MNQVKIFEYSEDSNGFVRGFPTDLLKEFLLNPAVNPISIATYSQGGTDTWPAIYLIYERRTC